MILLFSFLVVDGVSCVVLPVVVGMFLRPLVLAS